MTQRLVVASALLAAAVVVAYLIRRRQPISAPTQPRHHEVPAQLDRADFDGPETPWLVAVFTSATCENCARVWPKAEALRAPDVAVMDIPHPARRDLHQRYGIDVVPMVLVADADGVVRASFIGNPSATDLWAAVAEARGS